MATVAVTYRWFLTHDDLDVLVEARTDLDDKMGHVETSMEDECEVKFIQVGGSAFADPPEKRGS